MYFTLLYKVIFGRLVNSIFELSDVSVLSTHLNYISNLYK